MRASRLLSLLMLLQQRGQMNGPALAQTLGVSVRTVMRDIDHLSAAGVPVWAERGRDGGFHLREGWSTQLTGLTQAESHALIFAGMPSAATELGLGGAAASARLKMLAAVPANLRDEAVRVGARLHIDAVDWYRAATPTLHLPVLARAVWKQNVIAVRYESWEGVKNRELHPLGLVLKAGVWYCVARVAGTKSTRTFKLASIQSLDVSTTLFEYPKKFDLADFWRRSTQRFEREIFTGEADLLATARGMRRLTEMSAAITRAIDKSRRPDSNRVGWSAVTIPIESIDHAARLVLGLGEEAEVVAPMALREAVRALVTRIGERYQK